MGLGHVPVIVRAPTHSGRRSSGPVGVYVRSGRRVRPDRHGIVVPFPGMKINRATGDIRVLLFDVGGVLVQLSGVDTMLEWLGNAVTTDELWRMWLRSESVRSFETGQIDANEFADRVIAEFGIAVEPQLFLESFTAWPTGLYPGTLEMLALIPPANQGADVPLSSSNHFSLSRSAIAAPG